MRPFDKPALSVEQQLELLKQRGLHVANDDRAMRFLEVVTLFRLSPYMRPFQESAPEHTFKPDSTLKAVVDIYRFDGSLRRITMDAIERVEVAIRATISNHMSPKYGPGWIADASVFSSSYSHSDLLRPLRDQLSKERNKLGREIDRIKKSRQADGVQQQRIENRMRDNYFRFYRSTYGHPELPPAWAVLEELSLGTVSTLFNAIGRSVDKKAIASRFNLPFEVLASWLHTLTFIRNCCAHHSRLWNRELSIRPSLPREWVIPNEPTDRPQPKQRIYIVLTMLAYLTDLISPDSQWKFRLAEIMDQQESGYLRLMGFPNDWKLQQQWSLE
ncbi:Abi family protein [Pseudomonas cichorii]|nr:Abi family protein [Pseudomonas cichorii]MBX8552357.1 Abi family protein [Pseudomonas cichorii]MBX8557423.1 Abi family protein [Pseudomonas cichorii]MBX8587201.1 Abi family protein [Pseudomonas cichorii]